MNYRGRLDAAATIFFAELVLGPPSGSNPAAHAGSWPKHGNSMHNIYCTRCGNCQEGKRAMVKQKGTDCLCESILMSLERDSKKKECPDDVTRTPCRASKSKRPPRKNKGILYRCQQFGLKLKRRRKDTSPKQKKAFTHILYKLIFAVNVVNVMQFNAM